MRRIADFPSSREPTSPRSTMARTRDRKKVLAMDDKFLDDIRPMVWTAQVIAPAADADVTILMRVSYRSLEQICGSLFDTRDQMPAGSRLS